MAHFWNLAYAFMPIATSVEAMAMTTRAATKMPVRLPSQSAAPCKPRMRKMGFIVVWTPMSA